MEGFEGLDEDEDKHGKSRLMRRWLGGGAAASGPIDAPPAVRETEPPPDAAAAPGVAAEPAAPKQSWLQRLRSGLSRSSTAIARGVADIFTKRKLDAASLDDLEDVLIQADLGLGAAARIREADRPAGATSAGSIPKRSSGSSPPRSNARSPRRPAA